LATLDGVLQAVIFDVDGTLADSERDGHRVAFNAAFAEFGLPYHWDEELYGRLLEVTGGQGRIAGYLAGEGVEEAERERLAPMLHARKTELFADLIAEGKVPARPGTARLLDELAAAGVTVAVATTGTRAWVEPLLDRHFGLARFAAVVTGDEVTDRKPHPEAYLLTLRLLGADAAASVAVEDSANGVVAARAAGMPVLAVTNDYTADQDLTDATLVVDRFGTPGDPAVALHDPAGLLTGGLVNVATLRGIVRVTPGGAQSGDGPRTPPSA
jgi:HAD superfamily hydrolase (TIGR01509 family)